MTKLEIVATSLLVVLFKLSSVNSEERNTFNWNIREYVKRRLISGFNWASSVKRETSKKLYDIFYQ